MIIYVPKFLKGKMNVQNYDFGKNWDKVWNLMKRYDIQKIVKKIFIKYRKDRGFKIKYNEKLPPSSLLSSNDGNFTLMCDIIMFHTDKNYSRNRREIPKYYEYNLNRLGYNYKKNKDKLCFYIPLGCCHWWNRYFCLWLARKLLPDRKWEVRRSIKHTTIYSKETNEVFDILYWSLKNRLRSHELKLPYEDSDSSLGGNEAFENSSEEKHGYFSD